MIRIAIVEDDELYSAQLTQYLEDYRKEEGEEFAISVYPCGEDILKDYKAQYDILLLDIQLKEIDGMNTAEKIREMDSKVIIMFITNLPQYAIRGYEVGALDYILKPVSYFAFSQKLKRAVHRLKRTESRFVVLPIKGGVKRIEASDIYFIESDGHKLIYHTKDGDIISKGVLREVEETLRDVHFSRGNKGYLINLEYVEGIEDRCAIVKGQKLWLSRAGGKNFMQDLTKYWGEVR